ncbi:YggS family pyridoxal phosphate-dependent enzyme [Mycetocola zhadangensis]|uniref:Pyridoxal phosphate homeostasis protein n=1 Tax=Mycetocola zhadangensis TaxID=1164595 RepID=A0A3L7J9Y5_9MICO|nr:YggS family pyridoxal phosphate-dependent enzyme [Mycetocola zhadangensis]RLQ86281.1 YggS family pyridoxal phosphate-dependent enzyme [Mycetocola zhadangensis]GGE89845.1 YggS family pyridoxal phosphate enzyme [Mycetocola zhadangensis]
MTLENEQTLGQRPLAERLASVRAGISNAASEAGRDPNEITTIVVTKFHPVRLIEDLYDLGVRDVGENRHQEASAKATELAALPDLSWHFVGQLQSKKARQARQYASVVHSVDRPALVTALDNAGADMPPLPCFVQINLTEDEGRGGVQPSGLEALVEQVLGAAGLDLFGVMAVAPLGEDPRAAFARLRAYSERVVALTPTATRISAGMSHDYREAILEGATHLRIGTAITGNRPTDG